MDMQVENNHQKIPRCFKPHWLRIVRVIPILVFAVGLGISWLLWHSAKNQADSDFQEYFNFRVRQAAALIEQRILAQEQVLRGVKALFSASDHVSQEKFRKYVIELRLYENYSGILGVGYAEIVTPPEKDQHIAEIRQETGHMEYIIWPVGKRDFFTSVIYLEPFYGRNLRAFGYDMHADPVRRWTKRVTLAVRAFLAKYCWCKKPKSVRRLVS